MMKCYLSLKSSKPCLKIRQGRREKFLHLIIEPNTTQRNLIPSLQLHGLIGSLNALKPTTKWGCKEEE